MIEDTSVISSMVTRLKRDFKDGVDGRDIILELQDSVEALQSLLNKS